MQPSDFEAYARLRWKNLNTRRQYLLLAKRIEPFWEDDQISQATINNFMGTIADNISYGNSIYMAFVKNYLDCYSVDLDKLGIKIRIIKPTSFERRAKKVKFLGIQDVWFIIKFIEDKQLKLMIRLYFETGLRASELLNVRAGDIDLKARTISGLGKQNKEFTEHFSLGSAVWLERWLKVCQDTDHPFWLYSELRKGAYKNQPFAIWYRLKKACYKVGFDKMHPHKLRHSLGRFLSVKGFSLSEIKEKLRHESIVTTEIYAPAIKEEVDQKIDKLIFKD